MECFSAFSFSTLAIIVVMAKLVLLIFALNTVEPVANLFKLKKYRRDHSKYEFLFFSNISAVYAGFVVLLGLAKSWIPQLNSVLTPVYEFGIPTSISLEMVVVLIFWSLFIFKREWIIRTNLEPGIMPYLREAPKHLFPLIFLLLEKGGQTFEKSNYQRIFFLVFFISYFLIVQALVLFDNGYYIYPFLEHFNMPSMVLLFAVIYAVASVFYEMAFY